MRRDRPGSSWVARRVPFAPLEGSGGDLLSILRPWSEARARTDTAADMSAEEPLRRTADRAACAVVTRTRMRLDGAGKRP
jgi:hypothetical protein